MAVAAINQTLLVGGLAVVAGAGVAGTIIVRLRRRLRDTEHESQRTAEELNRRLAELFSLQELSYILSDSIQLDRIVGQVVRFAMRFFDARGALVGLAGESPSDALTVAGADGSVAMLAGSSIPAEDRGLVAQSVRSERIEVVRREHDAIAIAGYTAADSAAAVPLRAHGVVVGTLVLVEPRDGGGELTSEDIRLLSTVATHAAVALANARFFDLVRRGKEQWETAFDALSEGMAVVDAECKVRRANRALATMLGQPLPAVIGTPLSQALLGRSRALLDMLDAVRLGAERTPVLVARSDHTGRNYRVIVTRMPGATPDQLAVVLVEDVTDAQLMEAQLIQSEKLATVGQLVSGVAHELNNPLTSITGLSEFLLEQKGLAAGDRGHLKVIHEQAERAGRIVRNLLTFARKGPSERSRVDMNDLVQRTLLLMSYDLKLRQIEPRRVLSADLPDVMGDRHALQQVVLNLLTNAAQAVGENEEGRPRIVQIETWVDGLVHLRVADNGPGISDEVRRQLFTPFFSTKDPGQGTGLGLSISYSIVQAHGGHITEEQPREGSGWGWDGGAAFRVDLPPAPADAPHEGLPEPSLASVALPPSLSRRSILLVDDDQAVRRLVVALFAKEGHAVEVARSAQHALELAGSKAFDLILADGQTAAKGKLFVEELIDRYPKVKPAVLVATGDVRPTTEEMLKRLGLRYVRKPFNLRDLREEAARVWAEMLS